MTTIVINENTEEGRSLMNVIRSLQKSSDAVVSISDDDFERIPGLPYTAEERIESVRRSVEEYRKTGISYTTEELRERMAKW